MNRFILILSFSIFTLSSSYAVSFPAVGYGEGELVNPSSSDNELKSEDNTSSAKLGDTYSGDDLVDASPATMNLTTVDGQTVECEVLDGSAHPEYKAGDVLTTGMGDFTLSASGTYNGSSITAPAGYLLLIDTSSGEVALGETFPILKLPLSDAIPFMILLCLGYVAFVVVRKKNREKIVKMTVL